MLTKLEARDRETMRRLLPSLLTVSSIKKGRSPRILNFFFRISRVVLLLVTLLTVCYSGFVVLDLDWHMLVGKIKSMLLGKSFHFLFSRLGFGGLCCIEVSCALLDPENVRNFLAYSGGSGLSNSTSWTGKSSFEERVLIEPFPEIDTDSGSVNQPEARPVLPANPVASPGAAQEALPQAPAPAEVAHPAPDQEERATLREEVKTLIVHQLQEESNKVHGVRLSVLFPEMREIYSSSAESLMSYDLEISRETDAEILREWRDKIRNDPNLLKPLIKDYLTKRR